MSYLFSDGFDLYATLADTQGIYDSISGSLVVLGAPTGLGGCLDTANVIKTWGTQDGTLYFSFFGRIGNSTASNIALVFSDGSAAQCSLVFAGDSTITAHSGGTTGPVLGMVDGIMRGSSLPGVWGPWFSAQIKVVIGVTTGSVEVRMHGSATPVLLLSNVNTQAGTGGTYATKFTLGGTSWTRFTYLWLNSGSGSAPSGWPGETRVIRQSLASDLSVSFTPVPSAPNNYGRVNEASYDGDTTTVQSHSIGAEDLYTLTSVSLKQILGVNYSIWARKSEAGHRVGAIQSIANGSADTQLITFNPTVSYGLTQTFQPLDPTGATWTNTTLSGALVGIKIAS